MSYKVNATFIAYALSLLPEKTISLYNCHIHLPKGPRPVHTLSMHLTSNPPTLSAYTDSGCLHISAPHGNLQFSVPMESPLFDKVPFFWTDNLLLIPHFYPLHETHQILQQHLPSYPSTLVQSWPNKLSVRIQPHWPRCTRINRSYQLDAPSFSAHYFEKIYPHTHMANAPSHLRMQIANLDTPPSLTSAKTHLLFPYVRNSLLFKTIQPFLSTAIPVLNTSNPKTPEIITLAPFPPPPHYPETATLPVPENFALFFPLSGSPTPFNTPLPPTLRSQLLNYSQLFPAQPTPSLFHNQVANTLEIATTFEQQLRLNQLTC